MSKTHNFVVLCPNGRREAIKVNPNNSVLQVLEEACKKQKLSPDEHILKHYNRALDLTLPIRFANLPNNAMLEMHKTENSRKESFVTICLQLESGERFMNEFPPSSTIYTVLERNLGSDSIAMQDLNEMVCIYMRQKITGSVIKTTTLKSLGLTQGTAIIRLLHRKPEELEQQAHVSSPLTAPQQGTSSQIYGAVNTTTTSATSSQQQSVSSQSTTAKTSSQSTTAYPQKSQASDCQMSPERARKQPRLDTFELPVSRFPVSHASRQYGSSKYSENLMDSENKSHFEHENKNSEMDSNQNSEMDYEPSEVVEEMPEDVGEIKYIGSRHAVVYSLDDITSVKNPDLPDEFFELTVNDIRYLMEEYKRQRIIMEQQPLLTCEQRQKAMVQKYRCYSQTVIRIYFTERLVLQAVFNVTESIQTIAAFVQDYLENKNLNFYLYTTPPKVKLNPSSSLLEYGLVPAAVIHFGCDAQLPNYLKQDLREKLSDPRAAALAASESRKSNDANSSETLNNASNVVNDQKAHTGSTSILSNLARHIQRR